MPPDGGASEVIGSILMVAITIVVAASLVTVAYGAAHGSEPALRASLTGGLQANDDGWGTGDEAVTVTHRGGHEVAVDRLAIVVQIQGQETRFTDTGPNLVGHGGQDAFSGDDRSFTIGERWASSPLTIPSSTSVYVHVIDTAASQTIWSGDLRSGPGDCNVDTMPPTVASWTQDPNDVTTSTVGDITVTATLTDACAGVDTTQDPRLHFRLNDGTAPTFTDAGAMTFQASTTWQGTIPDQAWGDHDGETLEYKLVDMADEQGNTGESNLQQDLVDACPSDEDPPTVTNWAQAPSDVTTATSGEVTIDATLTDACAGVDTTQDPRLHFRLNDGTAPTFTDVGAMTFQAGTTWQGTIPDQAWGDHEGETLEYKLVDMVDKKGNTGESNIQQDTIQQVSSISYVQTPLEMIAGTASDDANARSADDGDAAATLTEASTGSSSTSNDHYGTTSSGSANNPINGEGPPDDQYIQYQNNGEAATVAGFPAGSGSISTVEIALEGRHDGGNDVGQPDVVQLSHSLGPTAQTYALSTSDTQEFLDVTGDRTWTWTDVENLDVTATCQCHDTGADNRQFLIDALWVRVTTTATTYDLETDAWTFDPFGGSGSHTLEIRYETDGPEAFQVQIWDGSSWATQSPILDQASFTVFTEQLTSAEVSAGPQIRILDQGNAQQTQGTLMLDYVRVVSS